MIGASRFKSIAMMNIGSERDGSLLFSAINPPLEIGQELIEVFAWARSDVPVHGFGKFFIVTPEKDQVKSGEINFSIPVSKWLQKIKIASVPPCWPGSITAIKIGLILGFKANLHLPGIRPTVGLETIWLERSLVDKNWSKVQEEKMMPDMPEEGC